MIPSVTPFFSPPDILTPVFSSASAMLYHSQIVTAFPLFAPLLICLAVVSFCLAFFIFFLTIKKQLRSAKVILELKPPYNTQQTAFSTEQLLKTLHSLGLQTSWWQCFLGRKKLYTLELVATRNEGIRYCLRVYQKDADILKKTLRAYIPGLTIQEIQEYLPESHRNISGYYSSISFRLLHHFTLPLQKQALLAEHDPIAYITTHMTKLEKEEMAVYQVLVTPIIKTLHREIVKELTTIDAYVYQGFDITNKLTQRNGLVNFVFGVFRFVCALFAFVATLPLGILEILFRSKNDKSPIQFPIWVFAPPRIKRYHELSPQQQTLQGMVKEKIGQELFEANIRIFVVQQTKEDMDNRLKGFVTSFSPFTNGNYQGLVSIRNLPFIRHLPYYWWYSYFLFKNRLPALTRNNNVILTVSELSSLFHFPYHGTTKTEDMVKDLSPELPAPLILKNITNLDVIFGQNTYGNKSTPIGLSDDDRSRHMYLIGQTGSGKSTILFHMAKDDIQKGRGVAVVDPHGDLVEDLLSTIPANRMNDVVYINPFDIKYPIGINLLELTPGLDEDEVELEKELVAESVISIFRRLFAKQENVDAHRIEHVLRNTIYTAFYEKDATIFTLYALLTDQDFQKKVVAKVTDHNLQNFWKTEFGKAGDYQIIKMISGVTAKIGRFLFSPIARRMLEQPNSTIDFDTLLDQGKIILCNLAEGKLGEDTSQLIGTTIITKIHLAILKRARMDKELRKPFYLFVDEFQNFATSSFTKLLSGGRKYGLRVTIAEQSTAQQSDERIVDVVLANVGTIVCFRTASPVDELLMLAQFHPLVEKGYILNLPRHHFYMKLGAKDPQEPFSGITLPMQVSKDEKAIERIIAASRKNYASVYVKPTKEPRSSKKVEKKIRSKTTTKIEKRKEIKKKKDLTSLTD